MRKHARAGTSRRRRAPSACWPTTRTRGRHVDRRRRQRMRADRSPALRHWRCGRRLRRAGNALRRRAQLGHSAAGRPAAAWPRGHTHGWRCALLPQEKAALGSRQAATRPAKRDESRSCGRRRLYRPRVVGWRWWCAPRCGQRAAAASAAPFAVPAALRLPARLFHPSAPAHAVSARAKRRSRLAALPTARRRGEARKLQRRGAERGTPLDCPRRAHPAVTWPRTPPQSGAEPHHRFPATPPCSGGGGGGCCGRGDARSAPRGAATAVGPNSFKSARAKRRRRVSAAEWPSLARSRAGASRKLRQTRRSKPTRE